MNYDQEEQAILQALEDDALALRKPNEAERALFKEAAISTFTKDRRVTIRLYDHDFKGIQKKAMEMGVPYQTLISGLIHSYVEGDLKLESARKKK